MSNAKLRKRQAPQGKVLTNGTDFSSVGGFVYLGKNDKAENWHEITVAEAKERQKELEEQMAID